jgi:hypothetical protein
MNEIMNSQCLRRLTTVSIAVVVALSAGRSWAIYNKLDPSPDDWGLKYTVDVTAADRDTLNVSFTLTDEGRLKPLYSLTVVAFSLHTDSQGGRSYDVKAPIELKTMPDGTRVGQVQIRREFADRATIRILTLTLDGRRQKFASYYDLPLKKFLSKAPEAAAVRKPATVASPPTPKIAK